MAQWVEDPALSQLQLTYDPWPQELPFGMSVAKKKKMIQKWEVENSMGLMSQFH